MALMAQNYIENKLDQFRKELKHLYQAIKDDLIYDKEGEVSLITIKTVISHKKYLRDQFMDNLAADFFDAIMFYAGTGTFSVDAEGKIILDIKIKGKIWKLEFWVDLDKTATFMLQLGRPEEVIAHLEEILSPTSPVLLLQRDNENNIYALLLRNPTVIKKLRQQHGIKDKIIAPLPMIFFSGEALLKHYGNNWFYVERALDDALYKYKGLVLERKEEPSPAMVVLTFDRKWLEI